MASLRKSFSLFSWGVTSFNERELKKVKIELPITKEKAVDYDYMDSCIHEMEESRIREMEAYLKVAGFEDCELSVEENNALDRMNMGIVQFKTFYVTDDKKKKRTNGVFNVKNSHNILQSSIVAGSGNIPYVTAGEGNNSISAYISYDMEQIEKGNAIMIGGKTMVITYQEDDFFSNDSHNLVLYAKDDNLRHELIQLFMVASLNKSLKPIYSWGDSISKAKIVKDKFDLPITPSGEIDYKFMETYICAQEKLAIQRVKDWRAQEIATTKNIVNCDSNIVPLNPTHTDTYTDNVDFVPMMVAEDIIIPGSLEVRLRDTRRDDLLAGTLDLVLMYAISPSARKKTESSGKIALGIKEDNLSSEAIKAYESVKYIMFHYWKNSEAKPFELTKSIRLVSKSEIPNDYLLRQEKDAKQFLLIEYDDKQPVNIGDFDVLKAQKKGSDRYIPFVCKVDNIKAENDD